MYFSCDIGGTKTRIAKSIDCLNFDEPIIFETPENPIDGLEIIIRQIRAMAQDAEITAIAAGIAGVLSADHSFLIKSPHLPAWEKIPIKDKLEKELNTKVHLENDTDIVGLGEYFHGSGRGYETCVYITISTGIGGVKINNGKFEKNKYGFEPGFMILNNESFANWEDLSSGTAVRKKFGQEPKDVAQTENWEKIESDIAVGLHNAIIAWSPEVLVIGGGMARDLDAERMKNKIKSLMKIHPTLPDIKIAELGSIGGIYGGFAFLKKYYSI